ncbi:MAG TPA: DNA-processing protein DprA [Acidobacteriota bacterium]|jgi:DNA processing protein
MQDNLQKSIVILLICVASPVYVNVHGMLPWLALNMVEGLRSPQRSSLLQELGTPENIFRSSEIELRAVSDLKPDVIYRILHFDMREAEKESRMAQRAGITILWRESDSFPTLLKTIPDPPVVLYVKGELRAEDPSVALVGSRKATTYGLNVAQSLARDLSKAGLTIVSGLARGVDARAHSVVIQEQGRTIGVLGSGIDVIYPSEHRSLADRIAKSGALISEFPMGTPPNRENFPVRNRIISGLSLAIVVIEASRKSGSLITARMASEQGRDVLAVPGNVFNESSQGCHALIRDGAGLVESWTDVIRVLPERITEKLILPDQNDQVSSENLTEMEKTIIALLSFEQPKHIDQLAGVAGMRPQDILGTLVSLELKSLISQVPGKQFIRLK